MISSLYKKGVIFWTRKVCDESWYAWSYKMVSEFWTLQQKLHQKLHFIVLFDCFYEEIQQKVIVMNRKQAKNLKQWRCTIPIERDLILDHGDSLHDSIIMIECSGKFAFHWIFLSHILLSVPICGILLHSIDIPLFSIYHWRTNHIPVINKKESNISWKQ